jgi:hypothetical protein
VAKRVRALQGDVDATRAESLVRAVREVATFVRNGGEEEGALATARDRLDRLSEGA